MIPLTEHAEGLVLPVRAQPGARRNGVQGEQAGALKVAVTAPAQDGRANAALVEVLREALGRPLPRLSMGMSNDFEVAVEEGATLVRLGTVLFEGLPAGEGG